MGISPKSKALIILIVILAVWIGGGVFLYFQVYQPSQSVKTTPYTQTTTTTSTTSTTSSIPSEEQAYIATITDHANRTIAAISSTSLLLSDPQLDNTDWASQITAQTDTLESLYDEISQLPTPYSLFAIHYNYSYAISIYKSAAVSIEEAISTQNTTYIEQAISLINSGTALFNDAITSLNDFIAANY